MAYSKKYKELLASVLDALDIDKEERPEMAEVIAGIASNFYNLGKYDAKYGIKK